MKPIDELQEILCTVESVEKDVKELRFGTRVSCDNKYGKIINLNLFEGWYNALGDDNMIGDLEYHKNKLSDLENHGNPLSQKHLMMYCRESNMKKSIFIEDTGEIYYGQETTLIVLDNTKELYEQEDKVLLDIINFLKG